MDPYDFICEAVKEAGAMLLEARRGVFEVSIKGGNARDIVTSVDHQINNFLIEKIKGVFPSHGIYSEEGSGTDAASDFLWVIDPIDGTANFSRHIPHFAICLGLLQNNVPQAGAVYNPVTGELFSFKKGGGAFLNGVPIQVSSIEDLSKAHVLLHAGRAPEMWKWGGEAYAKLLAGAGKTKNFSGASLDICFVAAGRVEANIYGTIVSVLDLAPALGILTEAGGVATDESGVPLLPGSKPTKLYMANNRELLEQVRTLLED